MFQRSLKDEGSLKSDMILVSKFFTRQRLDQESQNLYSQHQGKDITLRKFQGCFSVFQFFRQVLRVFLKEMFHGHFMVIS